MTSKPAKSMSALCVAQPWATCTFEHGKNVENKKTNLKKRGTIAIYASKSKGLGRFETCKEYFKIDLDWEDVAKGAIIGFVDIVDVIAPESKIAAKKYKKWWQDHCYGYVLANPIKLKNPVPANPPPGAIIFWHLTGKTLEKCLAQVPAARRAKFKEFE